MGYYIDLEFDEQPSLDAEAIAAKIVGTGALRIPDEDAGPKSDRFIDLLHPLLISSITVRRQRPEGGQWAYYRLSWATEPGQLMIELENLLNLAGVIGCRLYDGQVGEYVNREHLSKIQSVFSKSSANVIGLIGKVDKKS